MNKEKQASDKPKNGNDFIADVGGSFFRLNEWFDSNANSFGELNGQKLYEEKEAKRLCVKLVKEVIESVRENEFHFKNMSHLEVAEYILK